MKKILVSYFSASGVTARVAQKLSQAIDGDLHEIIPAQPYSQADLDWTNPQSRSSQEMKIKHIVQLFKMKLKIWMIMM